MKLLLLLFCCFGMIHHSCAQDVFRMGKDLRTILPDTGEVSVVFRKAATNMSFASAPVSFLLPARPESPSFSIDFFHCKTKEIVSENVEYTDSINLDQMTLGKGEPVDIIPGVNSYFRIKAGKQSFSSPIFTLIVPPAPDVSRIAIDYKNEKLLHLPMGAVWSLDGGDESYVVPTLTSLIPKVNEEPLLISIRCPATNISFGSGMKIFEIKPRPVIHFLDMNRLLSDKSFIPNVTTSVDSLKQRVYFESSNEDIAYIQDRQVYLQKEGECQITAMLEATVSGNHFSALPVTARLSVMKEDIHSTIFRVKNLVIVDGVHEPLLMIEHNEAKNPGLILYDVKGKIVHQSSSYMNDYAMGNLPTGTYYYILTMDSKIMKKGFIELLK